MSALFRRRPKYASYKEGKNKRHKVLQTLAYILVFFVIYLSLNTFILSTWLLESNGMQPQLHGGDRFIIISRTIQSVLVAISSSQTSIPWQRGNVVLIDKAAEKSTPLLLRLADTVVRFFTVQQITLISNEDLLYMKRVIGLPGDEVYMTGFVSRVKPMDSIYTLTEFELSGKPYNINIPQSPSFWNESLPFSNNLEKIILKENEYFVLSDDRSNTNDSRTWGPISGDVITGKAIFRYWPLTRLMVP
ncbi:MAG: signal peptidase I [Spirochaetaceae bacterium]|jgi:signal peptidase I|nr:signal peptidase I [Spirochaetaceae bacterium]